MSSRLLNDEEIKQIVTIEWLAKEDDSLLKDLTPQDVVDICKEIAQTQHDLSDKECQETMRGIGECLEGILCDCVSAEDKLSEVAEYAKFLKKQEGISDTA